MSLICFCGVDPPSANKSQLQHCRVHSYENTPLTPSLGNAIHWRFDPRLHGARAAFAAPNPIRVLLITGGCCHDYAHQKDILKKGITEPPNVVIEQIHTDDTSTHPPLAILGNPDYARDFDLVIHDECAADVSDPAKVEEVLKPHRDGIPGLIFIARCIRIGSVIRTTQ